MPATSSTLFSIASISKPMSANGTYARILGRYVRDQHVLPLEDAVRKASSAVAMRLSLQDRGVLREGMYADVVVFDPNTDRSRFPVASHGIAGQ